jgi:hypothetical protein
MIRRKLTQALVCSVFVLGCGRGVEDGSRPGRPAPGAAHSETTRSSLSAAGPDQTSCEVTMVGRESAPPDDWGVFDDSPNQLVVSITLRVGSEEVEVPSSAFRDLWNVNEVTLEKSGGGYAAKLFGGDAGAGYTCVLRFDRSRVKSRRVAHGELPEHTWEETTYHRKPFPEGF